MSFSDQSHSFSAVITYGDGSDGKPVRYADTHQVVKKPISTVRFGKYLPSDAVKLAYAAADELDSDTNLVLMDRSLSVNENSPDFTLKEEKFSGISFNSFYKKILVTDVFSTGSATHPAKPLYYKHTLPAGINTAQVLVLDSDFQPVKAHLYKVATIDEYDESTGNPLDPEVIKEVVVYNSLENVYDSDSATYDEDTGRLTIGGELTVYYVRYIDPDTNEAKIVLLNNEPVYHLATASDIWSLNLKLKPWVKAYLVEEFGTYYTFTFPNLTTYSVKYLESARIYLNKPVKTSKDSPWFLKVSNGSFVRQNKEAKRFSYAVPEFRNQSFNPVEPYKLAVGEEVEKIAENLVLLKHSPAALSDLPADIVIYNTDNELLYALTTDTTKDGTAYSTGSTVSWDSTKISSFDDKTGLVRIDLKLKDYHRMYATYYYKEESYEYTSLDLNPISNSSVLDGDGFFAIYAIPDAGEEAIYHVKVDSNGRITACSQPSLNKLVASGGVLGMTYGDRSSIAAGTFLNEYTVEAPAEQNGEATNAYIILGEASVTPNADPKDVTLLDLRVRGGGVKDNYISEAKQLVPEVMWFSDIGSIDGLPYPGRANVVVKLPYCILKDYGGRFTESEVRAIVKRHLALGHYPLIRFYGNAPSVSLEDLPAAGAVTITWPSEGSGFTYDIYYGQASNGKHSFTKYNTSPVADNSSGNSYTLTGLTSSSRWFVYVESISSSPCGYLPSCGTGLSMGSLGGSQYNRSRTLSFVTL